jgi:dual specificity phosphatase 12
MWALPWLEYCCCGRLRCVPYQASPAIQFFMLRSPKQYPTCHNMESQHITKIIPHLYVGDRYSVIGREDYLGTFNIEVVISALTEEEYADYMIGPEDFDETISWYRLTLDDDPEEPIASYFRRTNLIIADAIQANKNVLVHCSAGMSRSVTLAAAYLLSAGHATTAAEAISFIQRRREYASPNNGFYRGLVNYSSEDNNI